MAAGSSHNSNAGVETAEQVAFADVSETTASETAVSDPEPTTASRIPAEVGLVPAKSDIVTTAGIERHHDSTPDWPQFRGAEGQGHSESHGLPLRWSEKRNIAWKVPVRGLGWSSPVIADDRIWITTTVKQDKTLRAICLNAATGETIHDIEVFKVPVLGGIHSKNSHATPTPVVLNHQCLVHFGSHGTALLDRDGKILWKRKIEYFHHHGPAASPVIADGAAIIACDGMTFSFYDDRKIPDLLHPQFVIALEVSDGSIRWISPREGSHSYATPLAIEVEGELQIVSPGGNKVLAYNPKTGEEIWSCQYVGYSVVPRPVYGHGLVFICTGYDSPSLLAIRPTGRGNITESHVVWKMSKAVPLMSSPILVGDELYLISQQGVVTCLDARTGKVHWRNRVGGNHSSSPIYVDGKLYFLDEGGTTTILEPGLKFKVLARNTLQGKTQASLAISARSLFLRNENSLYRIEDLNSGVPESDDDDKMDSDQDANSQKK